jgi:hypothetical protein
LGEGIGRYLLEAALLSASLKPFVGVSLAKVRDPQ